MVNKIDHINIVVTDIEKAKDFFNNLGFIIKNRGVLQGDWINILTGLENVQAEYIALSLPDTQTNLELLTFLEPDTIKTDNSKINQTGYRHIAFEVNNIEEIVGKLKNSDIKFLSEIQQYKENNKKLCYFYGPENIIIEFAEYA